MLYRYFSHAARHLIYCAVSLLLWAGAAHATPFAYITNQNSNNVSVIDTASNTVVATVAVGTNPFGVAVNPAGTRAYVGNRSSNNVSVIDTATNTVVATVAVGSAPNGIAVNASGTRVYVTNNLSDDVSVIDTATNSVVATALLAVGVKPVGIAINPAGTRAYVANFNGNSISVIDTSINDVIQTVGVGAAPYGIAINPAGTRAYVVNGGGNVSVIDTSTNTVVASVAVGSSSQGIAVNPAGTRIYVANSNGNNVSVIDATSNSVVATVAVGFFPRGVAISPAGTRAYVANGNSANVSVIDTSTNTLVATVAVGTNPTAFGLFIGGTATTPGAPTIGNATPGNSLASISFTAPASDGGSPITGYTATCNPGAISVSSTASPLSVAGLNNGTAYTCSVTAANAIGSGPASALVSVTPGAATASRLINLSTRGQVQTGDNVMIGGFIIQGTASQTVLIRAVGPNLANFGVPGVLANPMLQLFSGQTVIASNDDWQSATNAAAILATGLAPANSLESAILITLAPGAYTAIVSGVGGGTGVGIVEVFAQ